MEPLIEIQEVTAADAIDKSLRVQESKTMCQSLLYSNSYNYLTVVWYNTKKKKKKPVGSKVSLMSTV